MKSKRMGGVYVVEFAIIGVLLFVLLFGVLEAGRLLFTVNTLNESVRRGARLAAVCDISDPEILRRAVFADLDRTTSTIIGNLESGSLTLDYLNEQGEPIGDPGPAGDFSLIRFVRVTLDNFEMSLIIPLIDGGITLKQFRAVLPRESLGRHAEGPQPYDKQSGITPC